MIDKLNGHLLDIGVGVNFNGLIIPCLMFVDDVILIADSAEDLQRALDATYRFFSMCHLQISQKKSNIHISSDRSNCEENMDIRSYRSKRGEPLQIPRTHHK